MRLLFEGSYYLRCDFYSNKYGICCFSSATEKSVEIEELVDDFVTFYTAGQEITSSVLTFALVLTLQHPNILEG